MAGVRVCCQLYRDNVEFRLRKQLLSLLHMFEYRPLGATELTFTRWNKQGVGRFYWVMGVDGPHIDTQLLHDAVRITIRRIPGLRSRLKRGMMETVPFEECPLLQVPVVEQDCDVISFTERLLKDTAFESSDQSPYPFVLVLHRRLASATTGKTPGPTQHLVAIMKHAFSDGISAVSWAGELVELLAKLYPMSAEARAAELQETVPLPQPPSADAQLAHHAKDRGGAGKALKNVVTMYQEKLLRLAKGDAPDFSTPLSGVFAMRKRRSRLAVATLPPAALTAVISACRSHGTTIGGALGAASFMAMQNTIFKHKGKVASLVIDVPVNTRPFSSLPKDASGRPSHQLHMLPADVLLVAREIRSAEEFWSTAREFQEAVHDFSKHPEKLPDVMVLHKWLSHPLSIPVSRALDRTAGLMLSNLGQTDQYCRLPPGSVFKPGPAYLGTQMLGFGQSLVVTLWTLRGELHITTTYTEPVIPQRVAQRFTEAIVQTLAAYANFDTPEPEVEVPGL